MWRAGYQQEELKKPSRHRCWISPTSNKTENKCNFPGFGSFLNAPLKSTFEEALFGLCVVMVADVGQWLFWDFQVGHELEQAVNHWSSIKEH